MKRVFSYLPFLVLFVLYSCDDEPLDSAFFDNNGGGENPATACQEATQATADASLALVNATTETYEALCNDFAAALQAQINACGDSSGALQATLDALDCGSSSNDDCANATLVAQAAQSALANASTDNYSTLCNSYAAALQAQINACGDDTGELQTIIDGLGDCSINSNSTLFLQQRITTYTDGSILTEDFMYDGDKLISISDSDGYQYEYIYENDLLSRINYYNSSNTLEDYLLAEYNSSNQLISYTAYITSGEAYRFDLTYITDNNITIQEYSGDHNSQTMLISDSMITIGNNQILVENFESEDYLSDFAYDSANGIYSNISNLKTLNLINIDFSGYIDSGMNNLLTDTVTDNGDQYVLEEYVYSYNSDNYPDSATYYYEGELDANIEYIYN